MKKILISLCLLIMFSIPAIGVNVTADLGEIGTLTVTDTNLSGVNLVAVMKSVLDRFQPPAVDEETGDIISWTNPQYKAILLQYFEQRGKVRFIREVQLEFESQLTIPEVKDYITITPPI